ncbi:hypothetical protein [Bacillus infantis]|uniref:hypothetical protein n=1 Tax=Bacillus infantis TaxID=324767 RepID=UPI003CE84FFB
MGGFGGEPGGQVPWLFLKLGQGTCPLGSYPALLSASNPWPSKLIDVDFSIVCGMDRVHFGEDIFCELMDDNHFVRQSIFGC